ncbi:MAG: hypothetical protein QG559_13 [Campylobacterota bacterium]|nr:hypothetical protein [Campylobacterota bacterium]
MFYKYTLYILVTSLLFSGCTPSANNSITPTKNIEKSTYKSKSGYYFVLIEKENKKWKIVTIQEEPIEKIKNSKQEILRVSQDYKDIQPYFINAMPKSPINRYDCTKSINLNQYNQCTSDLTSPYVGATVAKNIVSAITLSSTSGSHRYIDQTLINEAIEQTKLFDAIEEKKSALQKEQEYKNSFNEAKTLDEYNAFIEKYSSYVHKENLVALAIEKRDSLLAKQKADEELQKQKELELLAEEEAKEKKFYEHRKSMEKGVISMAKSEQNAIDNHKNMIATFRKNLRVGTETNCGSIAEIKELSAKINISIKESSKKEEWISINKLFPKEYGCRFVKGNYIAPPTF